MTSSPRQSTPVNSVPVKLPVQGVLPSLDGATGWLNSPPLTEARLQGKAILVNFWTYTCINWLRQVPYVRTWAAKYADDGLIVVGVHTPEFGFEADVDNVSRAVRHLQIDYPVAIDSEYAVWTAFGNRYWPALYFADAEGLLRHRHFGEGDYETSEGIIHRLVGEASSTSLSIDDGIGVAHRIEGRGAEKAADWANLMSPETYTGYLSARGFASPGGMSLGRRKLYSAPVRLKLNDWALSGSWSTTEQAANVNVANGSVSYRFHARDLHLVMGPAFRGASSRFRVRVDGEPTGISAGSDVDADGSGVVAEQRLHQLVRQSGPIRDRTFEITFLEPGVEIYASTFG